jgi:chromosome segregation protein
MYRSGETDYRLAGRSVRLSDIQALLAQAGVGAGSYAVIGQGMIDSILMSSPAERKLLFEEAAGIRGPELGREAALRKLTATATNLTRLRDISAELEPRLGTLQTAVASADERQQLQAQVQELRQAVVAAQHAEFTAAHAAATQRLSELSRLEHRLRHQRHSLEQAVARRERAEAAAADRRQALQGQLSGLEQARDQVAADLAAARAAVAEAQRQAQQADDLTLRLAGFAAEEAAAAERLADLQTELASATDAATRAAKAVDRTNRDVATAQAALVAIRDGSGDTARDQYLDHALTILKSLARGLGSPQFTEDQIRLLIHKAGRLLSHATRSGAAELLAELKAAQKKLEAAMSRRDTATEHQTNVSISLRSLEIDVAHQTGEAGRLAARREEAEAELKSLLQAAANLTRASAAETAATDRLAATTDRLVAERTRLAELTADGGDLTAASATITELAQVRAAIATLGSDQAEARRQLAAAAAGLEQSARQAGAWSVKPETTSKPTQSLATLTDALARTETLLQARTEQHEQQVDEYQAVTQRKSELATQIADLEAAEADLTQLVAQLDTLIRGRFKENFQALAEQFSRYFSRLFEGGTASLELSETADAGYGITIKASPAGKRLASIAALSGGERALAGVALVAAIMRVNPSPFVVLDEIDAALDEANSGRLSSILTELQQYSQLIVITHNRQTMKAAQVLFGVTLGENHVSHLISMRLEQATQLAAR